MYPKKDPVSDGEKCLTNETKETADISGENSAQPEAQAPPLSEEDASTASSPWLVASSSSSDSESAIPEPPAKKRGRPPAVKTTQWVKKGARKHMTPLQRALVNESGNVQDQNGILATPESESKETMMTVSPASSCSSAFKTMSQTEKDKMLELILEGLKRQEKDEMELYGQMLAESLKRLEPKQRSLTMVRILKLLHEAEFGPIT